MRHRNKQLGAITSEARLEYYLPASIADAIGGKGNYAFCIDSEALLKHVKYQSALAQAKAQSAQSVKARIENLTSYGYDPAVVAREAKKKEKAAKSQAKKGNVFADFEKVLEKEIAHLRGKGIRGQIPVCIGRSSGKRGSEAPRHRRRSNAIHERFHADARRVEANLDVGRGSCYKRLDELMGEFIGGTPLLYFSYRHYALNRSQWASEELLARVEEVRKACQTKRGQKYCDATIEDIVKFMPEPEAKAFVRLVDGVSKKYGNPMNVFRAAMRSCKVPR